MKLFNRQTKAQKTIQTIKKYQGQNLYVEPISSQKRRPRGIQIYNPTYLQNMSARDKEGRLISSPMEQPLFFLTVSQRIWISRVSSPIFGLVSGRMNRISGLKWNIVPEQKNEDRLAEEMKIYNGVYQDYKNSTDIKHITTKTMMYRKIAQILPDVLPDLSNFDRSLVRWKQRMSWVRKDKTNEIEAWIQEPNQGTTWAEYIKKSTYDQMIHGSAATYKQYQNGMLENFELLPGGSVYKIKKQFFSTMDGYIQYVPMFEPQIFFSDEMSYIEYLPTSSQSYGLIPLEALINKTVESLEFDKLMADRADGTRPPEKMVLILEPDNPFGDFDQEMNLLPATQEEQKRVNEKMSEPTKNAIMTFSGSHVEVVDLSTRDYLGEQMQRQKDIREEVGLVFNATNMEMNLTGSESTSGRSTSQAQEDIMQGRAIAPIVKNVETHITRDILPFRFGYGYMLEADRGIDREKELKITLMELQTGEMTVNEIREKAGKSIFPGEQYNLPKDIGQPQLGDEQQPMFTRVIE